MRFNAGATAPDWELVPSGGSLPAHPNSGDLFNLMGPPNWIAKVGGQTITSASDLHQAMQGYVSGQSPVFVWVDATGATHSAAVTLGLAAWAD